MKSTWRSLIAVLGFLALAGCGPSAKVSGTVTCGGKPVAGSILFSPKCEDQRNTGPAVNAQLKDDGTYELQLATVGPHAVVISPRDVKYPVKPGEFEFPCSLAPKDYEVTSGSNTISIDLSNR